MFAIYHHNIIMSKTSITKSADRIKLFFETNILTIILKKTVWGGGIDESM
jgi:hypothetical protein